MFNRIVLVGNLTRDIELRYSQGGSAIANSAIATSRKYTVNGEKKEETTWHNISVWGSLVKVCQYLDKGSKIYLEGEIKYEKYTDKKDGVEKQATKILASLIDIIKGKDREIDQHSVDKGNGYAPKEKAKTADEVADEYFPDDEIGF
jgi:single-strand DNA-binding protein